MRRHRQELKAMSEMNVTNLLDTAFILLMAFMLVVPAITSGIDLELPTVESVKTLESKKSITISIKPRELEDGNDRIYLDQMWVTIESLKEGLAKKKEVFPKMGVIIEIDKNVPWEPIAKVLSVINELGIEDIGLPLNLEDEDEPTRN